MAVPARGRAHVHGHGHDRLSVATSSVSPDAGAGPARGRMPPADASSSRGRCHRTAVISISSSGPRRRRRSPRRFEPRGSRATAASGCGSRLAARRRSTSSRRPTGSCRRPRSTHSSPTRSRWRGSSGLRVRRRTTSCSCWRGGSSAGDGALDDKRRARLEAALAEDAEAWAAAAGARGGLGHAAGPERPPRGLRAEPANVAGRARGCACRAAGRARHEPAARPRRGLAARAAAAARARRLPRRVLRPRRRRQELAGRGAAEGARAARLRRAHGVDAARVDDALGRRLDAGQARLAGDEGDRPGRAHTTSAAAAACVRHEQGRRRRGAEDRLVHRRGRLAGIEAAPARSVRERGLGDGGGGHPRASAATGDGRPHQGRPGGDLRPLHARRRRLPTLPLRRGASASAARSGCSRASPPARCAPTTSTSRPPSRTPARPSSTRSTSSSARRASTARSATAWASGRSTARGRARSSAPRSRSTSGACCVGNDARRLTRHAGGPTTSTASLPALAAKGDGSGLPRLRLAPCLRRAPSPKRP